MKESIFHEEVQVDRNHSYRGFYFTTVNELSSVNQAKGSVSSDFQTSRRWLEERRRSRFFFFFSNQCRSVWKSDKASLCLT